MMDAEIFAQATVPHLGHFPRRQERHRFVGSSKEVWNFTVAGYQVYEK